MSADWPILTLGDVCETITDGAHNSPKTVEQGKPMASVKDLTRFGVDLSGARLISQEEFDKLVKQGCQPEVGDVLIAKDGNSALDTVCTVDEPLDAVMLSSVAILRPDKTKLDLDFLKYYFCSKQIIDYLKNNFISGAAIPRVVLKDFRKAEIKVPPIDVQKKISKKLRTLDNKIELNHQTNQTLEQIAQAVFKSWFVVFEPTRAKIAAKQNGQDPERAAMAAISGKTLEELVGLSPEHQQQLKTTAALFPDALVESELGEIPEGWGVKDINQIAENVAMGPFGSNIKVDTFVDEGVPIINGQQLKGTMLEDGKNKFITHEHADRLIKSNVYRDDIVITHRGTLGQVSIIPEGSQYDRYIVSQSQCYIRPNKEVVSPMFLIFYLKSFIGQHELLANKSQVGVPSIAKPVTNIQKIELVVPAKDISDEFQSMANSLLSKISKSLDEIRTLEIIRNTLLPKLLSSELCINGYGDLETNVGLEEEN
ncbi:MAG: restriction endonuclease subunit S [Candidatus Sedimenticola sp. (ex Thyasira tokunagai)]